MQQLLQSLLHLCGQLAQPQLEGRKKKTFGTFAVFRKSSVAANPVPFSAHSKVNASRNSNMSRCYSVYQTVLYLHQVGDAYKVSQRNRLSLQRTHGHDVLTLLVEHHAVDACRDGTAEHSIDEETS